MIPPAPYLFPATAQARADGGVAPRGEGFRRTAGLPLILGFLVGAVSAAPPAAQAGPALASENAYQAVMNLPNDVQRVLVLPLTSEPGQADLADGCAALEQVLQSELAKTRKFEVICARPEKLRSRTGQPGWRADETLPPKFLAGLREAYGCDAVLFCQLTVFKAYTPLAVGWRLRLVDARSQQTLWASDEVFDAAQRTVQDGARQFERRERHTPFWQKSEDWLALHSPRRFTQFALASVLATLPER